MLPRRPTSGLEGLDRESFYLQQRNGFVSFDEWSVPEQADPRSKVASPVLTAWTAPANIGQSPPHVKHILHATEVCGLSTAGLIPVLSVSGINFPDATLAAASAGLIVPEVFVDDCAAAAAAEFCAYVDIAVARTHVTTNATTRELTRHFIISSLFLSPPPLQRLKP